MASNAMALDTFMAAVKNAGRSSDELLVRYLNHYGDYSSAQIAAGLKPHRRRLASAIVRPDIENSKLVVLFGNNFLRETRHDKAV